MSKTEATAAKFSKGRPTAEISQRKAAAILTVAREEFCAMGYRAVTMRGIADKAFVSTRTLYNHYVDKLSLFTACLDSGATAFPSLRPEADEDVASSLRVYAVALVRMLSTDSSRQLGMLVYREGAEFPELTRAADENQQRYLVRPLAFYLRRNGLGRGDGEEHAKILISMILAGWQRRVSFRQPLPSDTELEEHAALVVQLFLCGAAESANGD